VGTEEDQAYATLEASYRDRKRAYHNLRHIERVLETFLAIEEDLDPMDGARIILALCYHDAVYDPKQKDNEAKSAALARRELAPLGVEEADLAEIERLILVTKNHRASDPLGGVVVDADLAILASATAEYDAYAKAIRKEYAFVPDEEYRAGRRQVLESLLSKKLFASPLLDEEAARDNLEREIASLSNA